MTHDLRVHRHEIVSAFELQAVTGEIHERHSIRSRCLRLIKKIPECRAQGFAIEVARAGDVESRRLQGLGDDAWSLAGVASGPA
jgi:hypothetical protein